MIAGLEPRAGDDVERLEETIFADRFEAEGFVAFLDEVGGFCEAFGAIAAAFHSGSGESFNVGEETLRIGSANCEGRLCSEERQRRECENAKGVFPAVEETKLFATYERAQGTVCPSAENRMVRGKSCQSQRLKGRTQDLGWAFVLRGDNEKCRQK